LEKLGYPTNQICDKITKTLKGVVSDRHVQEALDAKYKDHEQSRLGKMAGNHDGRNVLAQQEQVSKKDVKDITLEDIKRLNKTKARQVAKHQISKALWWEQQAKQKEEKIQELTEQLKENDYIIQEFLQLLYAGQKLSDAQLGKALREVAEEVKQKHPELELKPKPKSSSSRLSFYGRCPSLYTPNV
jgi:uncharacterized protein with NRDE domain